MSYIKPPTKEEKAAYWEKFQTVALFTFLTLAFVILLLVLSYLLFQHTSFVIYQGLPFLMVLIVSTVVGYTYVEVYENWNMIYNRHRVGHYAYYMNSIFVAILMTVVSFGSYFGLSLIGAPTPNPYLLSVVSAVMTVVFTLYCIAKVKKDKPSLSPLTTEELDDREFLKDLYYTKLGLTDKPSSEGVLSWVDTLELLGCLDYYLNYGVSTHSQIEQWINLLGNRVITVKMLFNEMDGLNREHNREQYKEVYEKANDYISCWKHTPIMLEKPKLLKRKLQRYLD